MHRLASDAVAKDRREEKDMSGTVYSKTTYIQWVLRPSFSCWVYRYSLALEVTQKGADEGPHLSSSLSRLKMALQSKTHRP